MGFLMPHTIWVISSTLETSIIIYIIYIYILHILTTFALQRHCNSSSFMKQHVIDATLSLLEYFVVGPLGSILSTFLEISTC